VWEFAGNVLETHGLAAVVLLAVIGGAGFAVRELWKKNQELGALSRESLKAEGEKRAKMRAAHEKEIAAMRLELQVKSEEYAARLDELQEKRVTEAQEVVREVVGHVGQTQQAVGKITDALTFLRESVERRV
jgi:tRNA A37 N6-isopentenylltransferase MiaA